MYLLHYERKTSEEIRTNAARYKSKNFPRVPFEKKNNKRNARADKVDSTLIDSGVPFSGFELINSNRDFIIIVERASQRGVHKLCVVLMQRTVSLLFWRQFLTITDDEYSCVRVTITWKGEGQDCFDKSLFFDS